MMITTAERRAALQTMASRPSPGSDPGGVATYSAVWREYQEFHSTMAEHNTRLAVIGAHLARYEEATGERLRNPEIGGFANERAAAYASIRAKFATAGLAFPDEAGLNEEAIARARQSRDDAMAVRLRSTSWGSWWGNLAGSMAGAMTDPVNAAAIAFGAGWGAGILRTALIEGGMAMTSQAGIEAATWGYKRRVDPEWAVRDAGLNVIAAGAVGGIFAVRLGERR